MCGRAAKELAWVRSDNRLPSKVLSALIPSEGVNKGGFAAAHGGKALPFRWVSFLVNEAMPPISEAERPYLFWEAGR